MNLMLKVFSILLIITVPFSSVAFTEEYDTYLDEVRAMVESIVKKSDYYRVEGNESGFVIWVAEDGLVNATLAYILGVRDYSEWESRINVTVDFVNSIANFIAVCGIENPNLLFIIVDDLTYQVPLLIVCNGEVVYNCAYTVK